LADTSSPSVVRTAVVASRSAVAEAFTVAQTIRVAHTILFMESSPRRLLGTPAAWIVVPALADGS
jgi:hypothetical protein